MDWLARAGRAGGAARESATLPPAVSVLSTMTFNLSLSLFLTVVSHC
jgi:hypothetical protein